MTAKHILVTAVGGDLGQAIVKALRLAPGMETHGCDADEQGIAGAFVTSAAVVPPASQARSYLTVLDRLCRELRIDAVIPASEAEIARLATAGEALPCGARIVAQPALWLRTFGDKLKCMRALEGKLPLAPYADAQDAASVEALVGRTGFPVMVKPRRSSGSRNMVVARDPQQLAACLSGDSIVQAYLEDPGGEFSVGVFSSGSFTDAIAFRRELRGVGCSWYAETSDDAEVTDYALGFAAVAQLRGSANVQVRKTSRGVFLLEVNPRFSSLVAARAYCGFRDVEWSLALAFGAEPAPPSRPYRRIRFRRFFGELIDAGNGYRSVPEWTPERMKSAGKGAE